jgi:two-component sensor histidine kinase
VIHGLQGKTGQSEIRLCDLSTAIAVECEKLWHAKITVDKPDKWVPFIVHESESVPLALVLHELITNAVKHSHDKIVSIKFSSPSAYNVILTIENAGSIPHDFGIHNSEKFGTGLQLVASLLPPEGVKLYWEQQGGIVTTLVKVYAPVVQSEAME